MQLQDVRFKERGIYTRVKPKVAAIARTVNPTLPCETAPFAFVVAPVELLPPFPFCPLPEPEVVAFEDGAGPTFMNDPPIGFPSPTFAAKSLMLKFVIGVVEFTSARAAAGVNVVG